MSPTFVRASSATNTAGSSIVVPVPGNVTPGDELVAGDWLITCLRDQNQTSANDMSATGFARAGQTFVPSSSDGRITGFYTHVVSNPASEPVSYTFSRPSGGSTRICASMLHVRPSTASRYPLVFAGFSNSYSGNAGTDRTAPGFDITDGASGLALFIGATELTAGNSEGVVGVPSGYTQVIQVTTPGASGSASRTTLWVGQRVAVDPMPAGTIDFAGPTVTAPVAQAIVIGETEHQSVGQAQETDIGQPFTAVKVVPMGLAEESDVGQAFTGAKTGALGMAAETDAGLAFSAAKVQAVGQAEEADTAQAFSSELLGVAMESDTALDITPIGGLGPYPSPIMDLSASASFLLDCLCAAVAEFPNPPGQCCLRVGNEVVHDASLYEDLCCEGLAYVTVGDIYPVVDSFPEQSIVTQANQVCFPPSWAINLKMGIVRCAPTGTDTTMPTCYDWRTAAIQDMYDAQALAVASCCFSSTWRTRQAGMSVVIGISSVTGPEGGCIERSMTIQVQTPTCC